MAQKIKPLTEEQLLVELRKLERDGADALGKIAGGTLTALSAAAGAAVVPTIWSMLGFSTTILTTTAPATIFGSTWLAGILGLAGTTTTTAIAVATPPGWIAAGACAAGATGYLLYRFISNAGVQNEIRRRAKEKWADKITIALKKAGQESFSNQIRIVADCLNTAICQGKIQKDDGARLILLLKEGKITPEYALNNMINLTSPVHEQQMNGKNILYEKRLEGEEFFERLKLVSEKQAQEILTGIQKGKITYKTANLIVDKLVESRQSQQKS